MFSLHDALPISGVQDDGAAGVRADATRQLAVRRGGVVHPDDHDLGADRDGRGEAAPPLSALSAAAAAARSAVAWLAAPCGTPVRQQRPCATATAGRDRKSTRLNSSH